MPALEKPKHEAFARLLAKGVIQEEAYEQAGFTRHRGAASRLANHPDILDRIAEIKDERNQLLSGPTVYDESDENDHGEHLIAVNPDWVIQQLAKTVVSAQQVGNHSAANKALEMLGQYLGMSFADKTTKAPEGNSAPGLGTGNTFNIMKFTDAMQALQDQTTMKDVTPKGSDT